MQKEICDLKVLLSSNVNICTDLLVIFQHDVAAAHAEDFQIHVL